MAFCLLFLPFPPLLGEKAKAVSWLLLHKEKSREDTVWGWASAGWTWASRRPWEKRTGFVGRLGQSPEQCLSIGNRAKCRHGVSHSFYWPPKAICHQRLLMKLYINIWLLLNTKQNKTNNPQEPNQNQLWVEEAKNSV